MLKASEDQTVSRELTDAITAYSKAQYREAADILNELLVADRQNWRAWFYLGLCYAEQGQTSDAYRIMHLTSTMAPDKVLKLKARISALELKKTMDELTAKEDTLRTA